MSTAHARDRNAGRRRRPGRLAALAAAASLGTACGAPDAVGEPREARAVLRDTAGREVGTVSLRGTPSGVLLRLTTEALEPGEHAFHIHETGRCEPPFDSAGGHFRPEERSHGFLDPAGPHAGDLPNIVVPSSGRLEVEVLASRVRLGDGPTGLLDGDGSALVVHRGADDYESDPAGAAGSRIACGVVEATS